MIIPADFAQATFIFAGDNLPTGGVCTLGFGIADNVGSGQDRADTLVEFWTPVMGPLSNDVTFLGVELKEGPNDTGPVYVSAASVDGGDDDDSLSPNTTYLVRKVTTFGGRTNRGRMYLPGVAEGACDDRGVVVSGKVDLIQGVMNDFFDAVSGSNLFPVVLHSDVPQVPTFISNFVMDARVATQRRRLRR